jgi:glycine betaine/proline transport system substrate-binding protein
MTHRKHDFGRLTLALLVAVGVTLAGCGRSDQGEQQAADEGAAGTAAAKELRFVYVNWADGVAITNLARAILEDRLGYEVEMIQADVGPVYASVADGDADAFLDAWLPATHEDYMERFGDDLVDLGPNYVGCRLGLVVPVYAPGESIADLNDHADAYDGQIVGIDSGAGVMRQTQNAIEAYDLELTLTPSSGPAMTAALKGAVASGEPIVVTGWKPHWKFAEWDLRFLDDPQKVYGETEEIRSIVRVGFETDHPAVASFLRAFRLDDQQLGGLMGMIRESDADALDVARQWMAQNPEAVDAWLAEVQADAASAAGAMN